jgi:hypothetical protein
MTRTTIKALSLWLLSLTACSRQETTRSTTPTAEASPSAAAVAQPPTGPLLMRMRSVKIVPGGEMPFQIHDPLKNGEKVAYYVTADRDAYVYVVQFFPEGPQILFPDRGEQRLTANQETRVPRDAYFELFGPTGDEHVYVIATNEPLDRSDPELSTMIRDVRISPTASAPEPPPPPAKQPVVDDKGRGHALTGDPKKPASSAPPPKPTVQPALPKPPAVYMAMLKTRSLDLGMTCPPGRLCRSLKLVRQWYEGVADENGVVVLHFPFRHVD